MFKRVFLSYLPSTYIVKTSNNSKSLSFTDIMSGFCMPSVSREEKKKQTAQKHWGWMHLEQKQFVQSKLGNNNKLIQN